MKTIIKIIQQLHATKPLKDSELSLIAMILPGNLRRIQPHTLKLIKRELKKFNATTYEWEEE